MFAAEPLDYVSRIVNGKRHLPPLWLRRYAGPLPSIEASAGEFLAYLKLLCNLNPSSRVLDIGCGFGLLALYLVNDLKGQGRYVGVDINRRAISWATNRIEKTNPNFNFVHLNIRNSAYNPGGSLSAGTVRFPFPEASFDVVILKSVLTHLLQSGVENYLAQIAALLSPAGACLATFFILNDRQRRLAEGGHNAIEFKYGAGQSRHAVREVAELAVAYEEGDLLRMIRASGLRAERTFYGGWSGHPGSLSYQDILVLRRRNPENTTAS